MDTYRIVLHQLRGDFVREFRVKAPFHINCGKLGVFCCGSGP